MPEAIDVLVVDGPPSTTAWARWPALCALSSRLAPDATVLLDDGRRMNERRTARRWASEHPDLDLFWVNTARGAWRLIRTEVSPGMNERRPLLTRIRRVTRPSPAGAGLTAIRR